MKTLSLFFCLALMGSQLSAEENCHCKDCHCTQEDNCGCMASDDSATSKKSEETAPLKKPESSSDKS